MQWLHIFFWWFIFFDSASIDTFLFMLIITIGKIQQNKITIILEFGVLRNY